ncbi:3'-5' exoribonuclease YhaM family protein [Clostridium sp.]|uniref:3'-5' exoribonuclease YhaM family protein n=1 Tax=Clostridium sp. TaxID=1506 RepID=UPI003464D257
MENIKIMNLEEGKRIESFYLIKSIDCKTTNSNNRKYLDINLCDNSGEINAKLWDVREDEDKVLKNNTIVKVKGMILAWQGSLQLKIEKITNLDENDKVNIDDFVISAPYKSEDMYDRVYSYINSIDNKDIKDIVQYIFEVNKEKLMYHPAAKKNHHAIRGGLLYHILTMLIAGEKLCEVYDYINKDLLYGGIILHDMCKIDEMDANELGFVREYSTVGTLVGHISIGVSKINEVGEALGSSKEVIMLLQHMVLSHHYEPEYGSPIKPMIIEAEMLHYLDVLDARMYDMKKALNETKEGEFSERIWSLENRRVYNHNIK